MSDLDAVYVALKRKPDPVELSGEVERFRNEVADAFAKYFAAVLWEQTQGDEVDVNGYEVLYDQRGPKAMVLIIAAIRVVRDLANGDTNASLDAFLEGVLRGKT